MEMTRFEKVYFYAVKIFYNLILLLFDFFSLCGNIVLTKLSMG